MPHANATHQQQQAVCALDVFHIALTCMTLSRGRAPACQTWPSGQVSVAGSAIIADSHGLLEQDIGHQALVLQKLTGDG